jgi:tRNA uridine 5-carboxymethylaminomethyl modification enzyme
MFTSRAEHRLLFNHGSAECRFYETAAGRGLVDENRLNRIYNKKAQIEKWVEKFERETRSGGTWGDFIRRDGVESELPKIFQLLDLTVREEVLYRIRYRGYLEREQRTIARMQNVDAIRIHRDFSYKGLPGLRAEAAQKLDEIRPETIGQASRISGVNPTDVTLLMLAMGKRGDV